MSGLASNTHADTISVVDCEHKEDHGLLMQIVRQLADVWESLEPLNLGHCTEETLNCFIRQLQEVVKVVQSLPSNVRETHVIPKKALLQDLRSALIELLLARDQLAMNGRTSSFYEHLLMCQEYLGNTFKANVSCACSQPEIESISQTELPQDTSLGLIQKYHADFLRAQSTLENASLSSMSEGESSIEQFDCINKALNVLYTLVQELNTFSHGPSLHMQEETFSEAYQFYINISYLEEQIPRILELIKTFHSTRYSSSKQAKKIRREIVYNLESIVHSTQEVPLALMALLKLPPLPKANKHGLHLIYSSANG